jgi:hypothetical protein
MFTWMKRFWCRRVHRRTMWPIHGKYICTRCLQEYPVFWETEPHSKSKHRGRDRKTLLRTLPIPVSLSGSIEPGTYFTRAGGAESRKGLSKKFTSAAGMP